MAPTPKEGIEGMIKVFAIRTYLRAAGLATAAWFLGGMMALNHMHAQTQSYFPPPSIDVLAVEQGDLRVQMQMLMHENEDRRKENVDTSNQLASVKGMGTAAVVIIMLLQVFAPFFAAKLPKP